MFYLPYIDNFIVQFFIGVHLLLLMFFLMYVSGKVFAYFINVLFCGWEEYREKKTRSKKVKVNVW